MSTPLVCWKCGASLKELPLSRRAECTDCGAELHVCRMCAFYDPRVSNHCTEDRAEDVSEKERANFCDYFKPRPNAYVQRNDSKARAAKTQLDGLFAAGEKSETRSPGEAARDKLGRLFGSGDKKDE
ncbi:MAG: hypothetical protein ACE5NW_06080 [Acidiferrobacterales bacterium]